MRLALTALMFLPLPALADTFGPWDFAVPDDYERQIQPQGMLYNGPNGKFLFLAQTAMHGKPIADIAAAQLDAILGAGAAHDHMADQTLPNGVQMTADFAQSDGISFIIVTMAKDDAAGTAMFMTAQTDFDTVNPEMEALIAVGFDPVVLSTFAPSALPAMDWPAPPVGVVATSRPQMSFADARQRQIDPSVAPLRGTYACYTMELPRAVDARPDVQITFLPANRYKVTNGKSSGQGRWRLEPHDIFGQVTSFTGPMKNNDTTVMQSNSGLGQSFEASNPYGDGDMDCMQDGPMTDANQQAMAAAAPLKGLMDCTKPDGSSFKLIYADGVYRADGGQGTYNAWLEYQYGNWSGKMSFLGGPLDLQDGAIDADPEGGQELTLDQTWHEGSMFYTSSETTTFATCRMPTPARPEPVYGLDPSPPATVTKGGLPTGYFKSFESRYTYNGGTSSYNFTDVFTWVAPGGRIIEDPDLTAIGAMPDCTRTTPNGEEFCGEYRIVGSRISRRTERDTDDDAWGDFEPITITATGFTIDDVAFTPVNPPAPDALIGAWSSSNFTGSGPAGGFGVGTYRDQNVHWTFDAGGRFDWSSVVNTTTIITADPFLGGASGGGGGTFTDGGTGTYTLDGYWLTLTFADGRIRRMAVFAGDVADDGSRSLTIDGTDLGPG